MRQLLQLIDFRLDGRTAAANDDGGTLLDALREQLGARTPKDGCSPQGQCGCCTVWIDGAPRVSCVTPLRRVAGREVTTVDGLPEDVRRRWADAFVTAGASQCGFCTPGIVLRLAALEQRRQPGRPLDEAAIRTALLAHLCRCTGWQTIVEAAGAVLGVPVGPDRATAPADPAAEPAAAEAAGPPEAGDADSDAREGTCGRDPLLVAWRAQLEGPTFQVSSADTVLGRAGFADDTAPEGALVAVPGPVAATSAHAADADAHGEPPTAAAHADTAAPAAGLPAGAGILDTLVTAPSLAEARARSGKVQGRNSSVALGHPLEVPPGKWALTLRTTWVEPAYLEPDASWCVPGGRPATALANGGAFGGKRHSPVPEAARLLADRTGRPARVLWPREEVVRRGPKRPPVALGLRADGTGMLRVARTPGSGPLEGYAARVAAAVPGVEVEEVEVPGPPVSADLRLAGWAEVTAAMAVLGTRTAGGTGGSPGMPVRAGVPVEVTAPGGGRARVAVAADRVAVEVWAGEVLDEVTLRSYCIGAVHQALGWVRSEGIAVGADGA
ncbi:MAG: 2Fe-2S iron-sulfur cluster-binding protein, partial [Acidimicrobiales bacterium]